MPDPTERANLPEQPAEPPDESPMAARPRRRHGERLPAAFFVVSILAGISLAVVYWTGGQTQLEGVFLSLAVGGLRRRHGAVGQAVHAPRPRGGATG